MTVKRVGSAWPVMAFFSAALLGTVALMLHVAVNQGKTFGWVMLPGSLGVGLAMLVSTVEEAGRRWAARGTRVLLPWGPPVLGRHASFLIRGPALRARSRVEARLAHIGQHYSRGSDSGSWMTSTLLEQQGSFRVGRPFEVGVLGAEAQGLGETERVAVVSFPLPEELPDGNERQTRRGWVLVLESSGPEDDPFEVQYLVDVLESGEASEPPSVEVTPVTPKAQSGIEVERGEDLIVIHAAPRSSPAWMLGSLLVFGYWTALCAMWLSEGWTWWILLAALPEYVFFCLMFDAFFARTETRVTPRGIETSHRGIARKQETIAARDVVELLGLFGSSSSVTGALLRPETFCLTAETRDGRNVSLAYNSVVGRAATRDILEAISATLEAAEPVPVAVYGQLETRVTHDERVEARRARREAAALGSAPPAEPSHRS